MTSTQARRDLNGVDVPTLFATLDAVKGQPARAQFEFRASNEWMSGTHNRSTIQGFFGPGQEDTSRTAPSPTTSTIRSPSSVTTTGRPRWNSCCTRSRPA